MEHDNPPVLHRHGRFEVLERRHEVMFVDGTAIALHPVRENGHDSLFHRAFKTPNGLCIVFDLRHMCPPLGSDLLVTRERDVPGTVFYSLRHKFRTKAELVMAATAKCVQAWVPADEPAREAA
jgi:hypothetical protein